MKLYKEIVKREDSIFIYLLFWLSIAAAFSIFYYTPLNKINDETAQYNNQSYSRFEPIEQRRMYQFYKKTMAQCDALRPKLRPCYFSTHSYDENSSGIIKIFW